MNRNAAERVQRGRFPSALKRGVPATRSNCKGQVMGKPLRAKGDPYGRYRATNHGPKGAYCAGSGKAATSTSNMALTEAHKLQIEALQKAGKW